MTGINLNVQNSYAALYSTSQAQFSNRTSGASAGTTPETTAISGGRGEKLTLSAEAIALSQQTTEPSVPTDETSLGAGAGIRPPDATSLGGGAGIRPVSTP
jgi:hypothetical protein